MEAYVPDVKPVKPKITIRKFLTIAILLTSGQQVTISNIGGKIKACCPSQELVDYPIVVLIVFTNKEPVIAPTSEMYRSIFGIAAARLTVNRK